VLITDETHEVWSFLAEPGTKTWRAVTLSLRTLYIFINHAFKDRRAWLFQTSVFWQSADVLAFCQDIKKDKSRKIVDVWLLEPLLEGSIHTWRWTTVLEIRRYFEEPGPAIPVYFTDAGQAVGLTPEESHREMEIIYVSRRK
jgi:hypothetical protein